MATEAEKTLRNSITRLLSEVRDVALMALFLNPFRRETWPFSLSIVLA